uniref:Trehalose 6-phosphate phosphatase n=1 Tax=Helicotheca tamesis TaxID=374047 RepID=A0A7S2GVU4_9STRA
MGLAAEHGMFVSWPTNKVGSKRRWETLVSDIDKSWRSIAITIMEVYTSRTHGSYIEETEMKVLWQYRDADPEFGYLQSRELEDHLSNVLRSFAVDILHGGVEEGGYVEVRPKGVNKGVFSTHVLKNMHKFSTHTKVDFGLVLGDDHCDEPMLSVMRQVGRRAAEARLARAGDQPLPPIPATLTLVDVSPCDDYVSPELEMFTCTVGKKPSAAASFLNDVDEVHEILESLVKVATRDHKFHSAVDLRNLSSGDAVPGGFLGGMGGALVAPNTFMDSSMAMNESGGGFKRSTSMGELKGSGEKTPEVKVSSNLNEFLGTIEQDDDEEAFFF